MAFPVFLDTCALFGSVLNDLMLRLAEAGTYRPLWSRDVLDELERNLVSRRLVPPEKAARRVRTMRDSFPGALVTGYRDLEGALQCDPEDRHVLAAAVRGNAALLVTFNVTDFPSCSTDDFDLVVDTPDEFLLDQLGLFPDIVVACLRQQVHDYRHPTMTWEALLERLERAGVPRFVAVVRLRHADGMDP